MPLPTPSAALLGVDALCGDPLVRAVAFDLGDTLIEYEGLPERLAIR